MNKKLEWRNEKRKISELIPFEKNARQLSEKQYNDLKKSLERFNLAEIPAINLDNKICAGHQRLKILADLYGKDFEIDVRIPNRKLTDKEFEEYNIRSNKNTGAWDFDLLVNNFELNELIDFGFEEEELTGSKEEKLKEQSENLKFYKMVHVLVSFHPDKYLEMKELIESIKLIEGVEIEQSAN
jgi:hypothetical protein